VCASVFAPFVIDALSSIPSTVQGSIQERFINSASPGRCVVHLTFLQRGLFLFRSAPPLLPFCCVFFSLVPPRGRLPPKSFFLPSLEHALSAGLRSGWVFRRTVLSGPLSFLKNRFLAGPPDSTLFGLLLRWSELDPFPFFFFFLTHLTCSFFPGNKRTYLSFPVFVLFVFPSITSALSLATFFPLILPEPRTPSRPPCLLRFPSFPCTSLQLVHYSSKLKTSVLVWFYIFFPFLARDVRLALVKFL